MGLGTRPGSQWTLKVGSRMTGSEGLQATDPQERAQRGCRRWPVGSKRVLRGADHEGGRVGRSGDGFQVEEGRPSEEGTILSVSLLKEEKRPSVVYMTRPQVSYPPVILFLWNKRPSPFLGGGE